MKKDIFPVGSNSRARAKLLIGVMRAPRFSWRIKEDFGSPFFIVGSGRCGTTLLRRILQASPDIHVPPENWAMSAWVRQFSDYRTILSWGELSSLLLTTHLTANQGWFDSYPVELLEHLQKLPSDQQTLAQFIDCLYHYHGRHVGATFRCWGDKTPLNVNSMESILKIFPNARFIFMLRDPADVIFSWGKRRDYFNEIKRPAMRWKRAFESAKFIERKYPNQIMRLHYENLVRDPIYETRKVADFLDLEFSEEWVTSEKHYAQLKDAKDVAHLSAALGDVSDKNIGKGRRALSATQLHEIEKYLAPEINECGYPELIVH